MAKDLTNVIKKLGTKMVGENPTDSNSLTEIIDAIAEKYTGGGSGGVSDYNELDNKPIINAEDGEQYVDGAYYKTPDTETIRLELNDEISKIIFDVSQNPDFENVKDETWTEVETGMWAKTIAKLTHSDDEIYIIGVYAEFEEGGETIKGNQIMVCDDDPFAGAEPSVFLPIYSTMEGSGWENGSQGSFAFDATTGEFTWGQDTYVVAVLEAVMTTFAFEQIGRAGDLCRYINGELKKLITNDDVDTTSIESRLDQVENDVDSVESNVSSLDLRVGSVESNVSQAQSDISGIKDGQSIDSFADVESALNNKQDTIDSNNKVDADNVDDSNASHKFVTSSEKSQITANQNAIGDSNTSGTIIYRIDTIESQLSGIEARLQNI